MRLLKKTLLAFLSHPFHLNDAVFRISAKVGVAVCPDNGTDADTLFRNAESALKKAKLSGDKYLCYSHNMTVSVAGRLTLETQLRLALERKEFALFYQPKMNLASGEITGAEALLRWNDPVTGLVSCTFAPATCAPEGSETVPVTVPLLMDCPKSAAAQRAAAKTTTKASLTISLSRTAPFPIPSHGLVTLL